MTTIAGRAPTTISEFRRGVEQIRLDAARRVDPSRRSALGQFFTPPHVARVLAGLSAHRGTRVNLLDAGAGVGVLTAAWISHVCTSEQRPTSVHVTAFELDDRLIPSLEQVLQLCQHFGDDVGVSVAYSIHQEDFIRSSVTSLNGGLFDGRAQLFDCAILNPPYKKFRTDSSERRLLREVGVETSNLYTAFVALALRRLTRGGELIAITPRSFCNGPYFTPFRHDLLRLGSLTHLHVFDTRDSAFGADQVLQENIVFRAERDVEQASDVIVEWSEAGEDEYTVRRVVPFDQVVRPSDHDSFIHIASSEWDSQIAGIMQSLTGTLSSLKVTVSTGRVVDFRVKEHLRQSPEPDAIPLIYPQHLVDGAVIWPKLDAKKPNAIVRAPYTQDQINPTGVYVLVKRFSSKEERRRVVAALFTPHAVPGDRVAFENHLNYFHQGGGGLPRTLSAGLAGYLNSTLVDSYFRQFNGHTQVNATDLRKLPYPSPDQLERIGARIEPSLSQSQLDEIIEEEILSVPNDEDEGTDKARHRIAEAVHTLKALGLPKEQQNERAALTLLALLGLRPDDPWSDATNPGCGVTPIMEFAAEHYGKRWKPNTRETVRRFTLHQFQAAGLVVPNPDKPDRPVNSPAYCYQVPEVALHLLRGYGSPQWDERLRSYLASSDTLAARYASDRAMKRIPLRVREGVELSLSPGGQNALIEKIVTEFCPRFTPDAVAIYVGDADDKWGYFDEDALTALGVRVGSHGKMPDVVVHFAERNWLVLIEAVTSHGPVNPKRRAELSELFASSTAPLVYVTAFLTRQALNRYLAQIAWETEVWVADAPTHMIHFNGERFLGPYG